MTYTYKKIANLDDTGKKIGDRTDQILRKEDHTFIPCDESNGAYIDYLEWSKTNTIEDSD